MYDFPWQELKRTYHTQQHITSIEKFFNAIMQMLVGIKQVPSRDVTDFAWRELKCTYQLQQLNVAFEQWFAGIVQGFEW